MALCEITPVGEAPYYYDIPLIQGVTHKVLQDLIKKHTKGYKALPLYKFSAIWIFPTPHEKKWWAAYYHTDADGLKHLKGYPIYHRESAIGYDLYDQTVRNTLEQTFDLVIDEGIHSL